MFCCAAKKNSPGGKYQEAGKTETKAVRYCEQIEVGRESPKIVPYTGLELPSRDQIIPIMKSATKNTIPDELLDDRESVGVSKQRYQKVAKFQSHLQYKKIIKGRRITS